MTHKMSVCAKTSTCTTPDYAENQPDVKKMPHITLQERHTRYKV